MRRGIAVIIALALALALPAAAQADDVVFSQTESADPVNRGDLETYTVRVRNASPTALPNRFTVWLSAFSRNGFKAVNNPYRSATPSQGTCSLDNATEFKSSYCELGALAPGATATIKAVVEMNESMDHGVGALEGAPDSTNIYEPTTVIVPPQIEGSKKLKLKGLPDGCAADDFKLKVKAKGAKKIIASLRPMEHPEEKLKTAKGKKLKVTVPAAELDQSRLSELRVKATFRGKPQRKATATFQRC